MPQLSLAKYAFKTRNAARYVAACTAAIAFACPPIALGQDSCALGNLGGTQACTPYTVKHLSIIATFAADAFYRGNYPPPAFTILADASVVLGNELFGLFRIQGKRIGVMWTPPSLSPGQPQSNLPDFDLQLLGSFGNTALIEYSGGAARPERAGFYAVGTDRSADFLFSGANTALVSPSGEPPAFRGRDPGGILWFEKGAAVYAFYPSAHKLLAFAGAMGVAFQGPSGLIYATAGKNLMQLSSLPSLKGRFWRGPALINVAGYSPNYAVAISQIGMGGSTWGSDSGMVVHKHANGRVSVIVLANYPMENLNRLLPMAISIAPDGSAWTSRYDTLVRITSDDRVQVMRLAGVGSEPRFAPDGSGWVTTTDGSKEIIHFAPPND